MVMVLTVFAVFISTTLLVTWYVTDSIEIDQEPALYDKSRVRYTDGDNT